MYGLFKSEVEKTTMLVMEHVSLGSLDEFLGEKADVLDLKELEWMCVHIARGMSYLHSCNILHNDLAARNVLLTINDKQNEGKYLPKISDFGLAFQKGATGTYFYKLGLGLVPGLNCNTLTEIL
jgi:serine/threonine protein kinase